MKTPVHLLRQRVFRPAFASLAIVGLFAITISPAPGQLVPEPPLVAVPTNFFPPRDNALGQLRNAAPMVFANMPHMHLRNLRHVDFEKNTEVVSGGVPQMIDLPHTALFEFSMDGGQTWQPGSAPAMMTVRVAEGDVNGDGTFDTEMLALDISGGSLPAGVRLRESPTRASTGRIKVRFPTLPGEPESHWLRMSSFFDVWFELSADGGQMWAATTAPESIALDTGRRRDFHPSNFQPLDAALRKVDDDTIDFVGDAAIGRYVMRAGIPVHREPPPPPGQTREITIIQDMFADLSLDGGQTFTPVSAPAAVRVAVGDLNGDGVYETEMLQMDISGGSLPTGVMIRESPTRASLGRMTIEPVDGGFRIGSFFDVFTEISLDDGQTWSPATDSVRLQHRVESPRPIVHDVTVFPWQDSIQGTHDGELGAQTSGGLRVTNFEMTATGDGVPLPVAGAETTVGVPHRFVWDAQQDLGPIIKGSALGTVTVRIRPRDSFGNIRTFDTEMLALNLIGPSPTGFMIRESPTRASLGIIEVSDTSTGGDQRIGSFFDIFTEISVDGGQTWEQTDGPFRVALLPAIRKIRSASRTMPRTGTLSVSAGDTGHQHAGQGGAGAGKVSMQDFHFVMRVPAPALPEPGAVTLADFNGDGRLDLVLPDGSTASGVGALAGRVFIHHDSDNDGISYFDTEMLELSITGGTLPGGIMLRESPTLRSTGRTTLTIIAGGDFRIDSFFDVFTEISLDGGNTWFLSDGPVRIDMTHHERLIITGPGEQAPPQVRGFSGPGAIPTLNFLAYADTMLGGVRVAVGDVNGDTIEDIIVAPGSGAVPHVKVFDGATLGELRSFFAYDAAFTGGVHVAAGDVNGDGSDEIIVAPGSGAAPHVKVFDGRSGGELASFFAYSAAFTGGVRVAAGDVNGDGFADVITGAGAGAGPHVKVFDGRTGGTIRSFFAYGNFSGGVFVAAGDVNGDGRADIITGADAGVGPHVKVFDGRTSAELASFFAYGAGFTGGVRVASGDVDGDGRADIITGAGPGAGPHVKAFSGATLGELSSFFAYPAAFSGGVFVGARPPPTRILPPADLDGDGLLDVWEHAYFGSITAHDADDDSDGDGLSELEELGFGLNPKIPDRARAPAVTVEDGYLTLTLMKQLGAVYEVQSAGRLGLGGPDTFSADSTTILVNDATTLKVRDNILIGADPMRFLRTQVLAAP